MANDRHWDLFQCFFYGQDRFGAWPFLLMRIAAIRSTRQGRLRRIGLGIHQNGRNLAKRSEPLNK